MTQPQQHHRAKAIALTALLRNKKTADKIFAAMKAPHGSTQLKTAARLLRSVGRAADNKFGKLGAQPDPNAEDKSKPSGKPPKPLPFNHVPPNPPTEDAHVHQHSIIAPGADHLLPNLVAGSGKNPTPIPAASSSNKPALPPVKQYDPSTDPVLPHHAEVKRNGGFSQGEVDQMFMTCVMGGKGASACMQQCREKTGKMPSWKVAREPSHQEMIQAVPPQK